MQKIPESVSYNDIVDDAHAEEDEERELRSNYANLYAIIIMSTHVMYAIFYVLTEQRL